MPSTKRTRPLSLLVSGSVTFRNTGDTLDGVLCDISAGSALAKRGVRYASPGGGFGHVAVDYAFTLGAATNVTLRCARDGASTVARYAGSLSAIRVATLTTN